ncbi:MAG: GIY-YIG nuclease family protein [Roseivirga sp.]|nr:GIY-YIG nuclease family protein [Roseivirga sp.]
MQEFYVYILFSHSRDKYYVGSCDDLERRLADHNTGRSTYTRTGKPWELKYHEIYPSRSEARQRENEIKKKKSRKYIEYLISSVG